MPVPPNLTPETATLLVPSVPVTLDVTDAPTNADFPSTCDTTGYHAVWFTFTTGPNARAIAVKADIGPEGGSNYDPRLSIWTGTPPALTQYKVIGPSLTQNFCGNLVGGYWFEVPVTPSTTYYFQVTDANNTSPLGTNLVTELRTAPELPVPVGSIAISDDSDGYPVAIMSAVDGSFLRFLPFPAGELTDTVPSGEMCTQNGETDTGVAVLDATFTQIAAVDFAPNFVGAIKSDRNSTFYVMTRAGGAVTVHTVSKAGVLGGTTWVLPANSSTARAWAVTRDGATLYYLQTTANTAVHAYDLVNSVALPDLHAGFAGESLAGNLGDGYVASDGTILFAYTSASAITIRRFDAAGNVVQTYPLKTGSLVTLVHWCFADDVPGSFWAWGLKSANTDPALLRRVQLSDGATLAEFEVLVMNTSGEPADGNPFAISNSCPVWVLPVALAAPPVPPVEPVHEAIRCLRRFRLGDDKHLLLFIHRLEIICQMGVGTNTGQGADPQIMLRLSKDGGMTWGTERWLPLGKIGEYTARARAGPLGAGRDWVAEIVVTDPCFVAFAQCFIEATEGRH
jgi:hypothetical protein